MTDAGTPRTRAIAEIQEAASAVTMPEVIMLPTLSDAAHRACQDTVRILAAAVTDRGIAHLALTDGSGGMALSEALAPLIAAQSEEVCRAIHLQFDDERFVPVGDPEHNNLLAAPPIAADIRRSRTRRLATPNEIGGLDRTITRMTHKLISAGVAHGGFNVVHVRLGPDAHVCPLFPEHPATLAVETPAVAVRNSPKPPPEHYSLTFDTLQHAGRIMVIAGDGGKAGVVHPGLGAPDILKAPVSCCRREQITWYLDEQVNALATN